MYTMKTIKRVFEYELPIKVQKEKDGYSAFCPIWSDCYAQGDTVDEVTNEIVTVAQSLIDIYKEEDLTIPLKKLNEQSLKEKISFTLPVFVST